MNLSWIAEIVFFASYFVAWVTGEISNVGGKSDIWISISAWAALAIAALLVFYNGRPLLDRPASTPQV